MKVRARCCLFVIISSALVMCWACGAEATETKWVSQGIGRGGALFSISMSPHDSNEVYMTTDMSSVFHTRDYGQSWETVDFRRLRGGHPCQSPSALTAAISSLAWAYRAACSSMVCKVQVTRTCTPCSEQRDRNLRG